MVRDEVERVADALTDGRLASGDLGARRLASFLGRTTGVLYHHWGSLDGFLHAVANVGFGKLGQALVTRADGSLEDLAETYLRFAFEHPSLYNLMFERPFDWDALRGRCAVQDAPGVAMWHAIVARLEADGAEDPADDARGLYGALHGLASLALSGRANIGEIDTPDEEVAVRVARRLVRSILSQNSNPNPGETSR